YVPFPGGPVVNVRNRGIQFGTRWNVVDIENGGTYATDNSIGAISIAGTWEENSLMIAEAKIRTGTDIDGGLALVDAVRSAQGAGLAAVANTGLSQTQAIEELRSERRVSLYLRGVSFYDARRWGVTASVASGGGRANANVLVPGSLINSTTATILPCLIDYNYVDYWDVPQNELDFNAASSMSAPIKN
ncbi:MAG: RagB/SusD family nutrient uptake outer membrane protein, partial [Ginsengibacter sp.]